MFVLFMSTHIMSDLSSMEIVLSYIPNNILASLCNFGFTPEKAIMILYMELNERGYQIYLFETFEAVAVFIMERCNLYNISVFDEYLKKNVRTIPNYTYRRNKLIDICIDLRCMPCDPYPYEKIIHNISKNYSCDDCISKIIIENVEKPTLRRQVAKTYKHIGVFNINCKHCNKTVIHDLCI